MKAFNDSIQLARAISPVSVADTTAQVSEIIDTMGFHGLEFVIALGSIADADATFATTITESDDSGMSGATAVDSANLDGTLAAASFQYDDDNGVKKIGIKELTKRYVQLTITPTANASAALMSVVAVLHSPRKAPTT